MGHKDNRAPLLFSFPVVQHAVNPDKLAGQTAVDLRIDSRKQFLEFFKFSLVYETFVIIRYGFAAYHLCHVLYRLFFIYCDLLPGGLWPRLWLEHRRPH